MKIFKECTICPKCGVNSSPLSGLTLVCRGSKDDQGWLPVAVSCVSCGLEGPIRHIRHSNRTSSPWKAFLRQQKARRNLKRQEAL